MKLIEYVKGRLNYRSFECEMENDGGGNEGNGRNGNKNGQRSMI